MQRSDPERSPRPEEHQRSRYYAAALRALRFVEERSPTTRRFGSEADARWGAFHGSLTTADRIDLLIRDADAHWPSAFGARTVFALPSAAEEEAFGAIWAPLDPMDAEELWRAVLAESPPRDIGEALRAVAAAWDLSLAPVDVGPLSPNDRWLVTGSSAIASLMQAFAAGSDLDWSAQVLCVATPPAHRQLAALGAAVLQTKRATAFATKGAAGRRILASEDASPEDLAATTASL